MIIALVVVAVVVLAGAGVTVWLLTRDGGTSSSASEPGAGRPAQPPGAGLPTAGGAPSAPETASATTPPGESGTGSGDEAALLATAQDYTDAVNNSDEATATGLTCSKANAGAMYDALAGEGTAVVGDALVTGQQATVDITVEGGSGKSIPLPFQYRDGAWCVAV